MPVSLSLQHLIICPEFFLSHFLLALGLWFLVKRRREDRKVAKIFISLFVVYGIILAIILIPSGIEEIGIFAFIIPIYLVVLGAILGIGSFL